jgi:hypothetical protein
VAVSDATELARLHVDVGVLPTDMDRLPARCRRAVAVATAAGASVLEGLDGAAAAEADSRRAHRAVDVACAQTRAVAGGLLAAPLLLVPLLGRMLDADLVGFYARPVGWAVAGLVLLLLAVGAWGVRALMRRARRVLEPAPRRPAVLPAVLAALLAWWLLAWWLAPVTALLVGRRRPSEVPPSGVDEVADLVATALAAGTAPAGAVREVAAVRSDLAVPLGHLALELDLGMEEGRHPAPLDRVATILHAAAQVGAPAADALRRLAAELRADDLARALAAAERLPAQLTFPTALALLPAVLLAIGAPIAHAGLSSAAGIP